MPKQWWHDVKMPFGKYRGKTMFQILKSHPDYVQWAIDSEVRPNGAAGEAWDEMVRYYQEEAQQ
jgi:uncharacterized protein (DUF3820 family)